MTPGGKWGGQTVRDSFTAGKNTHKRQGLITAAVYCNAAAPGMLRLTCPGGSLEPETGS